MRASIRELAQSCAEREAELLRPQRSAQTLSCLVAKFVIGSDAKFSLGGSEVRLPLPTPELLIQLQSATKPAHFKNQLIFLTIHPVTSQIGSVAGGATLHPTRHRSPS